MCSNGHYQNNYFKVDSKLFMGKYVNSSTKSFGKCMITKKRR